VFTPAEPAIDEKACRRGHAKDDEQLNEALHSDHQ
jgi:hypothetical protein